MSEAFSSHMRSVSSEIDAAGPTKPERLPAGPQGGRIRVARPQGEREMVNLRANNDLGLANHPEIVAATRNALDEFGFGMASVRFICGAPELTGVGGRIGIVTGAFGKTLGGATGGFVAAARPIVDLLRQRARPYLFSNSLAPAVTGGSLKALEIATAADDRRVLLAGHAKRFREGLAKAGFSLLPGTTPIIPVMLHDARRAQDVATALDARGVFVAGFFFRVVPQARRASARNCPPR
jgi:7-keto-8-aminopelargonate synthetase-like enzyme